MITLQSNKIKISDDEPGCQQYFASSILFTLLGSQWKLFKLPSPGLWMKHHDSPPNPVGIKPTFIWYPAPRKAHDPSQCTHQNALNERHGFPPHQPTTPNSSATDKRQWIIQSSGTLGWSRLLVR